jgi:hypothetical protein
MNLAIGKLKSVNDHFNTSILHLQTEQRIASQIFNQQTDSVNVFLRSLIVLPGFLEINHVGWS